MKDHETERHSQRHERGSPGDGTQRAGDCLGALFSKESGPREDAPGQTEPEADHRRHEPRTGGNRVEGRQQRTVRRRRAQQQIEIERDRDDAGGYRVESSDHLGSCPRPLRRARARRSECEEFLAFGLGQRVHLRDERVRQLLDLIVRPPTVVLG